MVDRRTHRDYIGEQCYSGVASVDKKNDVKHGFKQLKVLVREGCVYD